MSDHVEANTTTPVLSADHVSVSFGRKQVLNDISFTMKAQEIMVVLGPNGSGKSTLIKTMLGLVPHKGSVRIFDKPPAKALHHIGYVPQHFDFDREFPITVKEFLMLSARQGGRARVEEVLEEVDMTAFSERILGTLSGGQLQRVLIARAILHNPDILLLDEPTSGVDIEGVKDFYELLTHLNETHHVSIILVSHELNVAYKFAHTILCLNKDMICYGTPSAELTDNVLKQLYGDDMAVRHHDHPNT